MNNRYLLTVTIAVLASTLTAEDVDPKVAELKRTGGEIYEPGSKEGEIVYVNCQSAAKAEWLKFSVDYFKEETEVTISIKKGEFNLAAPKVVGTRSLFIVDDSTLPPLLCAPESGWAMVNVANLKTDKAAYFEARVKKELSRGFAYLCGAANSRYKGSLLEGITSTEQLDRHYDHRLPVDVIGRMVKALQNYHVTPASYTPYVNACHAGWAPPPTNEYQKAIWERVKAETNKKPNNPLQIKYTPKADK